MLLSTLCILAHLIPMDEEKILSSHLTLEETEADGDEEPAHGTCVGGSHPQI